MAFFLSLLAFYKFNSECAFSYSSSLMKFWMTRGLPSRASANSLIDFPLATLAGKLGVKKLVMMSGLPAGAPGDKTPNWFTSTVSWPDYMVESVRYQWEGVAIPLWKAFVEHCKKNGVEQIAIEEFTCQLVHNPETLWKLRSAVDPMIGMNMDPSHLMVMGADPIAGLRNLEGAIYHIHGKSGFFLFSLVHLLYKIITNHSSIAISKSESLQHEFLHSQEQPLHYL